MGQTGKEKDEKTGWAKRKKCLTQKYWQQMQFVAYRVHIQI